MTHALPTKALVIGSGSIARRHIANLRTLLPAADVACVSASGRALSAYETQATVMPASLADALAWQPQLAVVASPAPWHLDHATALVAAGVPVLIEKPLSDSMATFQAARATLEPHRDRIEVAYILRYLSSSRAMKRLLNEGRIGRLHAVRIDIGQHLPDWRPQSDYRRNVSANKALGGGVLLELSHEFDYLRWLVGDFDTAYCITSNSGQLEVDVEDRADIMLSRRDGLVAQLHMDFLQRKSTRECKFIGEHSSLRWDLIANSIVLETAAGQDTLFAEPGLDRNTLYLEQMSGLIAMAGGRRTPSITLEDGVAVLAMIEAMRRSAASGLPQPIAQPS